MKLGVYFDGFSSTQEMLEVARGAEDAGADSLWFAQHMGFRDALIWTTAAVSVTRTIRLIPTAISPYLWPPAPVSRPSVSPSRRSWSPIAGSKVMRFSWRRDAV